MQHFLSTKLKTLIRFVKTSFNIKRGTEGKKGEQIHLVVTNDQVVGGVLISWTFRKYHGGIHFIKAERRQPGVRYC